jgi:hypothetical protein
MSTNSADEFLFGGDTAKRVKEIVDLNKSKVCKGQASSRGRDQRFPPCPSRGFKSYEEEARDPADVSTITAITLHISSIFRMRPSQTKGQAPSQRLTIGMYMRMNCEYLYVVNCHLGLDKLRIVFLNGRR